MSNDLLFPLQFTRMLSPPPGNMTRMYRSYLDESQWSPRLSSVEFQHRLRNVTSIDIRVAYPNEPGFQSWGRLQNVKTTYLSYTGNSSDTAPGVEICQCPSEYKGLSQ